MATTRTAKATWKGSLFEGSGSFDLVSSGAASGMAVSWPARTEEPGGKTSPEELIAAAHASCYAMALSNLLAKDGTTADQLNVTATATFGQTDAGFRLTTMELAVVGSVPGIDAARFVELATEAKDGCPVSNALKGNVDISVDARLA